MSVRLFWLFLCLFSFCGGNQFNKTSIITEDNNNVATNLCYGLKSSGVADIVVKNKTMKVWCDLDSPDGPWITFLKRFDGSTDFNRLFDEYKNGFGDVNGEYWLGLENIHLLTENDEAKLRIDMKSYIAPRGKGLTAYALYDKFRVGDKNTDYTLEEISGYGGTAGDMETTGILNSGGPHRGRKFSTRDRDYDDLPDANCANAYNGGWWFRNCYTACLTCGPWSSRPRPGFSKAMIYFPFTELKIGLIEASMKVKLPKILLDNSRRKLAFRAHYPVKCAQIEDSVTRTTLQSLANSHYTDIKDLCRNDCDNETGADTVLHCDGDILTIVWYTDLQFNGDVDVIPADLHQRLISRLDAAGPGFLKIVVINNNPPVVYPTQTKNGLPAEIYLTSICINNKIYNEKSDRCE